MDKSCNNCRYRRTDLTSPMSSRCTGCYKESKWEVSADFKYHPLNRICANCTRQDMPDINKCELCEDLGGYIKRNTSSKTTVTNKCIGCNNVLSVLNCQVCDECLRRSFEESIPSTVRIKAREKRQAQVDLAKVKAAIILAKNNDLGCEVHIAGLKVGLCNNAKVIPALIHQKQQIEKFLKGQKNEWE